MPAPDRIFILHRMDETRSIIEGLLPEIDHCKDIYPGWSIRDLLAHMTGWDEAIIDSLNAYVNEQPLSVPAIHNLDEYNSLTVSSRKDLDYEHVLEEWRLTRQVLRSIMEQLPEEKYHIPIIVPWGEQATVTSLVYLLHDHEEEHTRDILEWLKHPGTPLVKKENTMSTTVTSEQLIKASPAQVYYALTHATALHEWLCDFATVAPRPGGRMYLWWHGDFYSAGEYISLEENKSVKFKWFARFEPAPSEVTVTLTPKGDGTQVIFNHTVPDGDEWKQRAQGFKAEWDSTLPNLASVLETGLDRRTFDRPMLGININDFSPEIAKNLQVPVSEGIRLDEVRQGMGAHAAGLCKDDVVVELDGKPITNDYGSLVTALTGKKGGDKVEVVFYRGPQKKTVTIELSKRPVPDISWDPSELAKQLRLKYDDSLRRLETSFKDVSETEAEHEPAPGEWSAKQTLAHLIHTERGSIANLDDSVGGYERLADDWGGNLPAHINATVKAYGSVRSMLNELKSLSVEIVAFVAALPNSFIDRKASYFLTAYQMLEFESHTLSHIDQINAAIAMARNSEKR